MYIHMKASVTNNHINNAKWTLFLWSVVNHPIGIHCEFVYFFVHNLMCIL